MSDARPRLSPQARADTFALLVGFASLSWQTWIVRRLLAVFGGNELTIALALFAWLLFSGIGAVVGSRAKRAEWSVLAFPLLAAMPLPALLESFMLRDLFGLLPGEAVGPGAMLAGSYLLIVFPAIVCGFGFTQAVALQPERAAGAGRAYRFEAWGAIAAGILFTILFAFAGSPERGMLFLIPAPLLVPLLDSRIPRRRLRPVLLVFALFMVPTIHGAIAGSWDEIVTIGKSQFLAARDSRQGFLAAVKNGGELTIFLDGSPAATIPDPDRDQPLAHVPLALLPAPRRALVIGGAYSSLAPEMLRHPLERLDFIQPDPAWLDLERQYGLDPTTLPRLSVRAAEPRAWLRNHPGDYDLILINLPEPTSAAGERFFTTEFFAAAQSALYPGGILAFYAGATPPNLAFSRGDAALAAGLFRTASAVFPRVALLPLGFNLVLAGDERSPLTADSGLLSAALSRRGIDSVYLNPAALAADLDPARKREVMLRLDRAPAGISSVLHPRAYLSGLIGWAERVTSPDSALVRLLITAAGFQLRYLAPILLLPLPAIGLRFGPGRARAGVMAAAAGFGSIVIEIALLIAYQMQAGSVYFALAGLTAAFMAGLGLGSGRAVRAGAGATASAAAIVVALAAGLAIVGVAVAARNNFSSPLTFALFAALLALLGAGVGAIFVAATALVGGSGPMGKNGGPASSAGLVYGLELFGSAGGGLIAGVILIPCFGILGTLMVGTAGMITAGGLAWPSRKCKE